MADEGKVLVTGSSIEPRYFELLREAGYEVVNPKDSFPPAVLSEEALGEALKGCEGYIVGGDEWASAKVIGEADDLKIIAFLGVGYESFIDADGARDAGVPVTNTPGTYANSVAEFSIGMLLDRRRRILDYAQGFKAREETPQEKRFDLNGHEVGIVGMGHIGQRLAEILTKGFGAKVSYFNRSRKSDVEQALGIEYLSLRDLVSRVESLLIMLPERPETVDLIDKSVLGARDPNRAGLQIINTARPEITNAEGLLWGLDNGLVENVALDGWYRDTTEYSDRLRDHPSVIVTPHIASLTHDAREAMADMCVETVLRVLRGESDPSVVNGVSI